ncbi:MAG: hypothetical protein CVU09_00230 [Bacteroidetes bacterium HGW-Bacteroidetes-4]|jgi:hypothetical protein|nr:MAG: hypothetical protein CVU09_00230 [Bacteroidetes bacterium HGW-Bacteroidetes-4]
MYEKILAHLKTKLPGVQSKFIEGVANTYSKTITDESQIETTLSDGVIEGLKFTASFAQTEGDRRATEATNTAVKNFRDKYKLDENGKPISGGGKEPEPNDIQAIVANAVKAAVEPLQSKLEGFEKKESSQQLYSKLEAKAKDKKIPIQFIKGRTLEKEEDLESVLAEAENDYNAVKQDMINGGVVTEIPGGGSPDSNSVDAAIENWAKENEPVKK